MFETPRRFRTCARMALVTLAALGLSLPATAQSGNQQQATSQQSAQQTVSSADVPDAEVAKFAKSMNDVLAIQERVKQQIASEQDPAKAQQLKQQATQEMIGAIQKDGMQLDRYNAIARSMPKDAQLNQRIQTARKKLQGSGGLI
jgi:hypothetical protein